VGKQQIFKHQRQNQATFPLLEVGGSPVDSMPSYTNGESGPLTCKYLPPRSSLVAVRRHVPFQGTTRGSSANTKHKEIHKSHSKFRSNLWAEITNSSFL